MDDAVDGLAGNISRKGWNADGYPGVNSIGKTNDTIDSERIAMWAIEQRPKADAYMRRRERMFSAPSSAVGWGGRFADTRLVNRVYSPAWRPATHSGKSTHMTIATCCWPYVETSGEGKVMKTPGMMYPKRTASWRTGSLNGCATTCPSFGLI